jgi:hypothetical protein
MYHIIWKGQFETLMFRQDFLIRLSEGDTMKKIMMIRMKDFMIKNMQ